MIRKSKSASTKWKENPFIHSLQIIMDTSHYFFQNFSSFLHIVSFETNLGTSEGIFREMWTSLSCLRSKTDYRFKTWGTSQRGPASVTVYLSKKGEARWRKRTGNRCRLALLLSKSETNSFKYTLFYSSHNWQIDASIFCYLFFYTLGSQAMLWDAYPSCLWAKARARWKSRDGIVNNKPKEYALWRQVIHPNKKSLYDNRDGWKMRESVTSRCAASWAVRGWVRCTLRGMLISALQASCSPCSPWGWLLTVLYKTCGQKMMKGNVLCSWSFKWTRVFATNCCPL